MSRGRDMAARQGIHLLMDDAVTLGGTRFLGGTLWTDFRLSSFSLTHAFRSAQGRDGMVDYRRIRTGPRSRDRIEPEAVLAMHRATRAFLGDEFTRPHDGPTVVVTHHAPHPDSLTSRYAHLAWCDASDLSELIEEHGPDLWVHGHVHRHANYRIGRTRIVCNARGHADEDTGFQPGMVVTATTNAEHS